MARSEVVSVRRLPVVLTATDDELVTRLRGALERKHNRRFTVASIVRLAINELAKAEGVSSDDNSAKT